MEEVYMARLVEATSAAQVAVVRELFAEYARSVDEPDCFVGFERELDTLPGDYRLFLADDDGGCVALRFLAAGTGGDEAALRARRASRQGARPRAG
jgi:hypothetical protein